MTFYQAKESFQSRPIKSALSVKLSKIDLLHSSYIITLFVRSLNYPSDSSLTTLIRFDLFFFFAYTDELEYFAATES